MNYDFLSTDKPRPHWVKYIGFAVGIIALSLGLFLKLAGPDLHLGIQAFQSKVALLLALLTIINSKSRAEDERTTFLRMHVIRFGFNVLIGIISILMLASALDRESITIRLLLNWVLSIVTTQVMIMELTNFHRFMDWAEKRPALYQLIAIVIIVLLLQFYTWLG